MFTSSKHNPRGTTPHFDNERVRHRSGDPEALAGIVALSRERTLALIRFHGSHRYLPECELVSNVTWKLVRSVHRFDPARGSSAFTFMSCLIENELRSSVTRARRMAERHVALDEAISIQLVTRSDSQARDAIDDLAHKIRSEVKTTLSDPAELQTMRWLVDSFLNGAFELRRHKCADAARVVHGISHERSRQLHDICLLECRRVTFDSLPPRPMATQKCGTRRVEGRLRESFGGWCG